MGFVEQGKQDAVLPGAAGKLVWWDIAGCCRTSVEGLARLGAAEGEWLGARLIGTICRGPCAARLVSSMSTSSSPGPCTPAHTHMAFRLRQNEELLYQRSDR